MSAISSSRAALYVSKNAACEDGETQVTATAYGVGTLTWKRTSAGMTPSARSDWKTRYESIAASA